MNVFNKTSHLSKILEDSEKRAVIVFKHSLKCHLSNKVKDELENLIDKDLILNPIYIVEVQNMPFLTKNIAEIFNIKHESPQVIIINKGKAVYFQNHDKINPRDFVYA